MKNFTYEGKTKANISINGHIDANSLQGAIKQLTQKGIIVVHIKETPAHIQILEKIELTINKPNPNEIMIFSRQMYSLLKAGLPITKIITILSDTVKNKLLKLAIYDVLVQIDAGHTLAQSMRMHPDIFPGIMIALVEMGEDTGNLDQAFLHISHYLENDISTRKRIKSALRYPIIVICTILIAIIVANVFIIPTFAKFFTKFNAELPLATRLLLTSSAFMLKNGFFMLCGSIAAMFAFCRYITTPTGKYKWDKFKFKIPIIGSIIYRALLVRFARSFALILKSGIPVLQALHIVTPTLENAYIAEHLLQAKSHIEQGDSLSKAINKMHIFPTIVLQMITIGEETGELDNLLQDISNFYEQELDYDLKNLSSSIEPILVSIVSIMVLILALGIFLPMWNMSSISLKGN